MTDVEIHGNERVAHSKTASAAAEAPGEDYRASRAAASASWLGGATEDGAAGAAGDFAAALGPVDACCLVEKRNNDNIMKKRNSRLNSK